MASMSTTAKGQSATLVVWLHFSLTLVPGCATVLLWKWFLRLYSCHLKRQSNLIPSTAVLTEHQKAALIYWRWGSCSAVCPSRPKCSTWCADHTQRLYLARLFSLLSPSYSSIQPLSAPAATWLCAQSRRISGEATGSAHRLHGRVVMVTNGAWCPAPHGAGHCPALA